LQTGAFRSRNNAQKIAVSQSAVVHYPAEVVLEDGWYKVRFGGFANKKEADLCKTAIVANDILAENQIREIQLTRTQFTSQNAVKTAVQPPAPILPAPKQIEEKIIPPSGQTPTIVTPANQQNSQAGTEKIISGEAATTNDVVTKSDNILKRHYYIQVGAFINPKNATSLIKKITKMLPYSVGIVYRDQFYKVRYGPFETQDELNDCIRLIVNNGIMQKALLRIFYEEIGSTPVADKPHMLDGFHVQIGAFRDKANAVRYFKKMSTEYPYPILIIEEDGYYKVRFGPFKALSDLKKCHKHLVNNGVSCFMRSNTEKYF
jgi:cell division protein FtsN